MTNLYFNVFPCVVNVMSTFALENNKRGCELLEMIEDLTEYAISVIVPHIRLIVQVCLNIGTNSQVNEETQIKAIGVLGWLIRSKSKVSK